MRYQPTHSTRPYSRLRTHQAVVGVLTATLGAGLLVAATSTPASAATPGFSCRGSALRTSGFAFPPANQEPVVANDANAPCATESDELLDFAVPDVASAQTLNASTDGATRSAAASVEEAALLGSITAISLAAEASTPGCQPGVFTQPVPTGSSTVARVQIGAGEPMLNVDDPVVIPLGPGGAAGTLYLNRQTVVTVDDTTTLTQQALFLDSPLGDVVLGEAKANVTGNPCAAPPRLKTGPKCSDRLDNDGDGKIDFPADTGCTGWNDTTE